MYINIRSRHACCIKQQKQQSYIQLSVTQMHFRAARTLTLFKSCLMSLTDSPLYSISGVYKWVFHSLKEREVNDP